MELIIAIGLPTLIIIFATLLLANGKEDMPDLLHWLSQRSSTFWNVMVGTTIAIAAIKYFLSR
jgi:hypothetical protein